MTAVGSLWPADLTCRNVALRISMPSPFIALMLSLTGTRKDFLTLLTENL